MGCSHEGTKKSWQASRRGLEKGKASSFKSSKEIGQRSKEGNIQK